MTKMIALLVYLIAVIFPAGIYVGNANSMGSDGIMILAGSLGVTAYVLFSFQFLLASRLKCMDRIFGLDKIYRFHMITALVAIVFAYLHKILKESNQYFMETFKTTLGEIAFFTLLAITVSSVIFMVNKLFFKIRPIDDFRNFFKKKVPIKYQYKVIFHNITLIALFLLMIHIVFAYSVAHNLLLMVVMIVYSVVPVGLYGKRKVFDRYVNGNKNYQVKTVIHESPQMTTLHFKPEKGKVFSYLPGQFLYVRLNSQGVPKDEHPFTISSSPTDAQTLSITVKNLGDFSGQLDHVKLGDKAKIDGPFGTFSYMKNDKRRKICFLAGGVGITPFISMIRHMNATLHKGEVTLLWGVNYSSEIICKEEMESLQENMPAFTFVPVVANEASYEGAKGFVDCDIIKKYATDILSYDFYVCGPPIMMEIQLENLKKLGVPKKNIYYEKFSI